MDEEDVMQRHSGISRSRSKDGILPLATTWVDLDSIMLSEISQAEKNKYHMISLYVDSKKTNE